MAEDQFIIISGAREHNLKNISLNIPKRKITVFTGVSGSGKSSLVFDTIAAEAQRQLNQTFTAFVQGFLPHYGQPEVDRVEHLNAPVIIDQKPVGGGSRSTVGTYTDIAAALRLLFARAGQPAAGPPFLFSFNTPPAAVDVGATSEAAADGNAGLRLPVEFARRQFGNVTRGGATEGLSPYRKTGPPGGSPALPLALGALAPLASCSSVIPSSEMKFGMTHVWALGYWIRRSKHQRPARFAWRSVADVVIGNL